MSRRESGFARTTSPLILVVDDSEDNRDLCATYLSLSGYRVLEAEDGFEALETAATALPDLIVMDLAMPRMDGWEAIERLEGDARTRDIPVIVLTGSGITFDPRARGLRCASFLLKPCLPQDLVRAVAAHLPPLPVSDSESSEPRAETG